MAPSTQRDPQPKPIIPPTWSGNRADLLFESLWTDDSVKGMLEKEYKIPEVRPLITRDPEAETGDVMFLLESTLIEVGKEPTYKYYVWNGMANVVCRIDEPKELNGIYERIKEKKGYLGGLKMEEVYPVATEE